MIGLEGKYYQLVESEPSDKDLCYQCDYMQNKGFLVGTCEDTPCDVGFFYDVLKEVDYAYI